MIKQLRPVITICIPLYDSEQFLQRCLESVAIQMFNQIEVIVVDDCSPKVHGSNGKDIVKKFKKTVKFPVEYIRHQENKGLVEVRRTTVYEAKGEYVLILDSDDTLAPDALQTLYQTATTTNADIVHGKAECIFAYTSTTETENQQDEEYRKKILTKVNNVFAGEILGLDIINGYLVQNNHQGFLWGKLFRKEVYLEALNHIPPVYCTMAEDVFQYFWIAYHSKKYVGIDSVVYNYSIDTGISSHIKIDSLERWKKVCSTASVFTSIYYELDRLQTEENITVLNQNQQLCLQKLCGSYLLNNLKQLEVAVIPELKSEARILLYEFWGEDFVKRMETLQSNKQN